jgi:Flp pilus assembly protein TadD
MIDPFDIYPWNNKGISLSALGRQDEAAVCFQKAIEIDSEYAVAWKNLAVAYRSLHRDQEAEEAARIARDLGLS